jgi:virginiamycin B lyase
MWLLAALASVGASTAALAAPGDELPDGPGKKLLQVACVYCHEVSEITKFRGYYSRAQWRDVVGTMIEYGAPLSKNDAEVLSDYLAAHLGRTK